MSKIKRHYRRHQPRGWFPMTNDAALGFNLVVVALLATVGGGLLGLTAILLSIFGG